MSSSQLAELDSVLVEIAWKKASQEDAEFIRDLFVEQRAPQFEPLGLPSATLFALLNQQYCARTKGYESQFPSAITYVSAGIGASILSLGESIHLVDLTISECERGKGHGTRLLQAITSLGWAVSLTVEESNVARRLYDRLGFEVVSQVGFQVLMSRDGRASPKN